MPVSTEFVRLTQQSLAEIAYSLDPIRIIGLRQTRFYVQYAPTHAQITATGTRPNQILMGLYRSGPRPSIVVFESSLRTIARRNGNLKDLIKDTLEHEVHHHLFGLNHSVREYG